MPQTHLVEFDPSVFTPLLTLEESVNPRVKLGLTDAIRDWDVPYSTLLERFTDLNKNYRGRFYDPMNGFINPLTGHFQEAFVRMRPLEDAPAEWWRDNFGSTRPQVEVVRVRVEAVKRWRAIGSIYRAWCPAEFHGFVHDHDNDNQRPES